MTSNKDQWEDSFYEKFGNTWEYEKDHTEWWIDKIRKERASVRKETIEEVREVISKISLPVYLMQDGVSADFSARDAFNEALDTLLNDLSALDNISE